MKKQEILFFISLFALLCGCSKHEHVFTEWKITDKATIYTEGKRERKCTECGKTESEIIPKIEYKEIAITEQNFKDFFEFVYYADSAPVYSFDDPEYIWHSITSGWVLKEEYFDSFLDQGNEEFSAICHLVINRYPVIFNPDNMGEFTYYIGEYTDVLGFEYDDEKKLEIRNDPGNHKNYIGIFLVPNGYMGNEEKYYDCIFEPDNFIVKEVKGTLLFRK